MFLYPTIKQQKDKAEVVKSLAQHLSIDLNAAFKGKNYNDRFFHWNVVTRPLLKNCKI